jgi:hypothetical protein
MRGWQGVIRVNGHGRLRFGSRITQDIGKELQAFRRNRSFGEGDAEGGG